MRLFLAYTIVALFFGGFLSGLAYAFCSTAIKSGNPWWYGIIAFLTTAGTMTILFWALKTVAEHSADKELEKEKEQRNETRY